MSPITTVIFDMYETLVENHHDQWRVTFKQIIRDQGLDVTTETLWQAWLAQERGFRDSRTAPGAKFQTYYQGWHGSFVGAFQELSLSGDPAAACHKSIEDLSQRPAYPETREALASVQRHYRTALLSNADEDYFRPNLKLLGVEFEQVLSSEEARSYKPQPGLFLEMLRRLAVTPDECLYVGDRQFEDVKGASGVGMGTVWLNRTEAPLDPKLPAPRYQINNLLELPALLTRIQIGTTNPPITPIR
ncbi:MAG: hypothetical protein BZY88_00210 [SAR202 cluster bacterium Io17-Chloro-G9]|nr:MAG: hypothetical protein BZY88_00210 [SAR202 cluster bacterium Io17-Chloro-G9]